MLVMTSRVDKRKYLLYNYHKQYLCLVMETSQHQRGMIQINQTWHYHVSHRIAFPHTSRALNVSKKEMMLLLVHSPSKEPNSDNSSAGPTNSAKLVQMTSSRQIPLSSIRGLRLTVLKNQASSYLLVHVTFSIHSLTVVRFPIQKTDQPTYSQIRRHI